MPKIGKPPSMPNIHPAKPGTKPKKPSTPAKPATPAWKPGPGSGKKPVE